jgi:hypothetical protein
MKTKAKPADQAFSKCVRERAGWKCEKCDKQHEENSMGLHCSHIFSRRFRTIRWAGDNAQALCYGCHSWYGGNPADSGKWIEDLLGEGHIELLREKRDSMVKVSKLEEKEIAAWYRKQLKIMKEKRANGETGRLEFESYQ